MNNGASPPKVTALGVENQARFTDRGSSPFVKQPDEPERVWGEVRENFGQRHGCAEPVAHQATVLTLPVVMVDPVTRIPAFIFRCERERPVLEVYGQDGRLWFTLGPSAPPRFWEEGADLPDTADLASLRIFDPMSGEVLVEAGGVGEYAGGFVAVSYSDGTHAVNAQAGDGAAGVYVHGKGAENETWPAVELEATADGAGGVAMRPSQQSPRLVIGHVQEGD